jgi:hypothetical protein
MVRRHLSAGKHRTAWRSLDAQAGRHAHLSRAAALACGHGGARDAWTSRSFALPACRHCPHIRQSDHGALSLFWQPGTA